MNRIIFFLILLLPGTCFSGIVGTLNECRPGWVRINGTVNSTNKDSLMKSYSGIDFPDQAEWDACEIAAGLKAAKASKKEELKYEALVRMCQSSGYCYESWNKLFMAYNDWTSINSAARQPTAAKQKAIDHYLPWKNARDAIDNYTGLGSLAAFDSFTGLP